MMSDFDELEAMTEAFNFECEARQKYKAEVSKWREVASHFIKSAQAGIDVVRVKDDPVGRGMFGALSEALKCFIGMMEEKGLSLNSKNDGPSEKEEKSGASV